MNAAALLAAIQTPAPKPETAVAGEAGFGAVLADAMGGTISSSPELAASVPGGVVPAAGTAVPAVAIGPASISVAPAVIEELLVHAALGAGAQPAADPLQGPAPTASQPNVTPSAGVEITAAAGSGQDGLHTPQLSGAPGGSVQTEDGSPVPTSDDGKARAIARRVAKAVGDSSGISDQSVGGVHLPQSQAAPSERALMHASGRAAFLRTDAPAAATNGDGVSQGAPVGAAVTIPATVPVPATGSAGADLAMSFAAAFVAGPPSSSLVTAAGRTILEAAAPVSGALPGAPGPQAFVSTSGQAVAGEAFVTAVLSHMPAPVTLSEGETAFAPVQDLAPTWTPESAAVRQAGLPVAVSHPAVVSLKGVQVAEAELGSAIVAGSPSTASAVPDEAATSVAMPSAAGATPAAAAAAQVLAGSPALAPVTTPLLAPLAGQGRPAAAPAASLGDQPASRSDSPAQPLTTVSVKPSAEAASDGASGSDHQAADAATTLTAAGTIEAAPETEFAERLAEPAAASAAPAEARAAATPVRGAPETVAAFAAEIARKLENRSTRFEVALDPLGLGMVKVSIDIGVDGKLAAQFAFERPETAAEMRGRSQELQRALEQAGFDLSRNSLSFDGGQGRERGGAGGDQPRHENARAQAFQQALLAAETADALPAQPLRLRDRPSAGLDVRI